MLNLQETMTIATDSFDTPGHSPIGRIDGNVKSSGSGTHILS